MREVIEAHSDREAISVAFPDDGAFKRFQHKFAAFDNVCVSNYNFRQ